MIRDKISKKWIIIAMVSTSIVVMLSHQPDEDASDQGEVKNIFSSWTVPEEPIPGIEAPRVRRMLLRLTYEECEVLNWARYDPVMPHTTILLVIVRRGIGNLFKLIMELQKVSQIHTVLLIFSHSYYNEEINNLVRNIKFCKVMQIFYPYSVQAYPDQFPGVDENDCNPKKYLEGCVSRDARRVESKHHWWWSAHFVFESLEWSDHHRGMVVFLQEDSTVQPGLLQTLKTAQRALSYFPAATLVLLESKVQRLSLLQLEMVYGGTMIPAFNASAWRRLNSSSILFCTYNDSSWWYSLLATVKGSGAVAVHAGMTLSQRDEKGGSDDLADRLVWLWGDRAPSPPPPLPYGDFGDIRDQLFCLDPLINKPDTFTLSTDIFTSTYIPAITSENETSPSLSPMEHVTKL